jgi:hypothetical protein
MYSPIEKPVPIISEQDKYPPIALPDGLNIDPLDIEISEGNERVEYKDDQLRDLWEEAVFAYPVSIDGFDAMPLLSPISQLSRTIEHLLTHTLVPPEEYGKIMLGSKNASIRAIGGILMYQSGELDQFIMADIVSDEEIAVPFLILEWIRDYGPPSKAAEMVRLLGEREINTGELFHAMTSGRMAMGGGRVAVDLLAEKLAYAERWEVLLSLAGSEELEYDTRMRSILRLSAEEDAIRFREELNRLLQGAENEGEDWAEALQRLTERIMDDNAEELAPLDIVSTRDLNLIIGNEHWMYIRDIALYLEDRMLRPDVLIEPGATALVAEFLKELPDRDRDWNVEDEEALMRLHVLRKKMAMLEYNDDFRETSDHRYVVNE